MKEIFENHSGIFTCRDRDREGAPLQPCYAEFLGENIVGWLQFKIYEWLGDMSLESWDGHHPWDYNAALFFDRFGVWEIDGVYGGGYTANEFGSNIDYYPYPESFESLIPGCEEVHDLVANAFEEDEPWKLFDIWLAWGTAEGRIQLIDPNIISGEIQSTHPQTYHEFVRQADATDYVRKK